MTRYILPLLVLLLTAGPVRAWEATFRAASADVISGGATKPYESSIGMSVLQCPSTGCLAIIHGVFPDVATSQMVNQVVVRRTSPDTSPTGNICDEVCLAANIGGGIGGPLSAQGNPANWTCSSQFTPTVEPQWGISTTRYQTGIRPTYMRTGTPTLCGTNSATECNGAELYIIIKRDAGCTAATLDYTSVTLEGQ